MSYKSTAKLNHLLSEVFSEPEITNGIEEANLSNEALTESLEINEEKIWSSAISEIAEYDNLQLQIEEFQSNADKFKTLHSTDKASENKGTASAFGILGFFLFVIYLVYFLINYYNNNNFNLSLDKIYLSIGDYGKILLLVSFLMIFISWPLYFYYKRIVSKKENQYREQYKKIESKFNIEDAKEKLKNNENIIDKSIIEKSIKPLVRSNINRFLNSSYENTFNIKFAPGLAEYMDPSKMVDTGAKERLKFMIENMPGGSIGIAGPRGAGKSTLIHAYCGPNRVISEIKNCKILPVLTTAPVQYEGRDFILHLFSALCLAVLKLGGKEFNLSDSNQFSDNNTYVKQSPLERIYTELSASKWPIRFFLIGLVLTLFSILLAGESTNDNVNKILNNDKTAKVELPNKQNSTNIDVKNTPSIVVEFFRQLGLGPGTFFSIGFTLVILGYVLANGSNSKFLINLRKYINSSNRKNIESKSIEIPVLSEMDYLIKEANDWLGRIKFQQSFTSGWSGAIKLPIGLETGITKAVTLAEKQMSNPELVASFNKFISSLPTSIITIIGIDEMDKIESEEQAQKFLNEIKSIFGLPQCFYLISVSESAMSNFERRGLPFRDVFDSSFDTIVYVDYLNLNQAKRLLEKRVIGKYLPFFSLSYCLSGGLPRDLIRTFRYLVEIRQRKSQENDIDSLSHSIIDYEIKSKANAMIIAFKKIGNDEVVSTAINMVFGLKMSTITSEYLANFLFNFIKLEILEKKIIEDSSVSINRFYVLKFEFLVFLYFAMTILDFFNNELTELKLIQAEENLLFDKLSKARQTFSVDLTTALNLINDFRKDQELSILLK